MGYGHPGRIAPRALQPVYQLLLAYSNVAIPIDVLKTLFSPEGLYFALREKNKMMYPFSKQMEQESGILEDFELARLLTITRDAIRKARQKEMDQFNVHIRRASLLRAIDSLGDKATPVARRVFFPTPNSGWLENTVLIQYLSIINFIAVWSISALS
jgi:hypothetical protein